MNEEKRRGYEIEIYRNQTKHRVLPRDLGRWLMLQQGDSHASGRWAPGDRRPVRPPALVYIAALAPDGDETSQSQQEKFPVTDVFSHIEIADGRIWMLPDGVECFAGDLSDQEKKFVWATHFAPAADLFTQKLDGVAWRSKPTSYIVATNDRTVQPELQRFVAKRMGATTHEVASSHVPMLSHPDLVINVIRAAAKAVQGVMAKA